MNASSPNSLRVLPVVLSVVAFVAPACALDEPDQPTTMTEEQIRVARHVRSCDNMSDEVRCHARVLIDARGNLAVNAAPAGYGPSQLRSAYKITGAGSSSTTIAIVAAFGYPTAEADLASYRSQFALPACTTANGCFRKVNQSGGTTSFPTQNVGWSQEQALDLDMASAICSNCKLLLVEANSASFADLAAGVNT